MKRYIKPSIESIELSVEEKFAVTSCVSQGNCTYDSKDEDGNPVVLPYRYA